MKRHFNVTGQCDPEIHYMVDLGKRLEKLSNQVDHQEYLYVQRGRQYGKTTLLMALAEFLRNDYIVLFLDFQDISDAEFANEQVFTEAFVRTFCEAVLLGSENVIGLAEEVMHEMTDAVNRHSLKTLGGLFVYLRRICSQSSRPIVMIVDEVDSATNNQVFLDFLALIRSAYLKRRRTVTFQSVILAGVYDIKNLKKKINPDDLHEKNNSPWNIAAEIKIDMNFSSCDIQSMLAEYEDEHKVGMNLAEMAQTLFDYTSGYPYLVSAICKILDEQLNGTERFPDLKTAWTKEGISEAVRLLLKDNLPLFGSMVKHLERYPELKSVVKDIVFNGRTIPFSAMVEAVNLGQMFGYLKDQDGLITVSNRIFEMLLTNMFIAEAASESDAYRAGQQEKNLFIRSGKLDMDRVMAKFFDFYSDIFRDKDEKFVEANGREIFLMYLKPIINGTGNYYIESATRTMTRTDVVVDYLGEQFVIELKIWHGQEYQRRGEKQLSEYLDYYRKDKGYLLSFCFNKKKEIGLKVLQIGEKMIVEVVV